MALSGITIANGDNTANGLGGGLDNAGTVTITGSTFTGNTALYPSSGDGGAIDSGDLTGGSSLTATDSTFTGNTASYGGAIDSSDYAGAGTVTVTASTFSGNTASYGGAIASSDYAGAGTVTVTASTFCGNTASGDGNTIDSGDDSGFGSVLVAGDVFDGSCYQAGGTWTDGGYNAGSDNTCFSRPPATGDVNAGSSSALNLGPLAYNGGPTQTIAPGPTVPATVTGLIPDPTTVTLGGRSVFLCPAADQRGYASAAGSKCDAGAVQTTGSRHVLTLTASAYPAAFHAVGQVITYSYTLTGTSGVGLYGITVTDPAVPGIFCPRTILAIGASETCTGSHTVTAADLAAGKITDTAAAATAWNGIPVAPVSATVTVPDGWPPPLTGTYRPAAHAAEGYHLGATGNTWQLLVTHPGTASVPFTGHLTIPAGTLGHLTLINPATGHQVTLTGRALTFTLPDTGQVTGFRFTTSNTVTTITLTLGIGGDDGHPAAASQIYLGSPPPTRPPAARSPTPANPPA